MKKYILIISLTVFFSCGQKDSLSLELNFTSKNPDIFQELKTFNLTSLTTKNKTITFKDIKSNTANRFLIEHLSNDLYIVLLKIEKNGAMYNISIDSIKINNGKNTLSKEINLGTVQL